MRKKKEGFSVENNKDRDRFYSIMSDEQIALFDSIHKNIFTFCEATSGSGKTICSVAAMLSLLERGEINKIVYIQKPSERYLSQGYLPGTMEEKSQFLFLPFYDAMHDLGFFDSAIEQGIIDGTISLITDCALRGVNLEKAGIIVDECLDGASRIATEGSNYKLETLYNMYIKGNELPKALTINEKTGILEYKNIVSVTNKGDRETMLIKASNKQIRCTYNHPILTVDGWKRADELSEGDILVASNRNSNQMPCMYNNDQIQLLIGSYLGDGSFSYEGINKYTAKLVQGEKQLDYLMWKSHILGCDDTLKSGSSGYTKNSVVFNTTLNTFVSKLPFKTQNGYKNLSIPQDIIDNIDVKSIAIWFMDDGSLSKMYNCSTIWCCAFDLDSIERLCNKLNEFNLYPTISQSKGYNYLKFNKNETNKLSKLICKYIPECMEYKILPEHRNCDKYVWDNNISELGYTVVTKLVYDKVIIPVYDMEVKDNHNFCVVSYRVPIDVNKPGIFVHNCQNNDVNTLKLIFTRCHDNCHIVMLGDRAQKDNKGDNSKFVKYGDYLAENSFGNKVELTKNFRGKFSMAAEAFEI